MNEKTIKLLKQYAERTGKSEKDIKRWWVLLSAPERTREKKNIKTELAKPGA